jgi:RNA polymerase sigma-70 factor, ECF subfamily
MAEAALTTRFEADRAHLRGVAYRLTGSLADAEDAVQQAWLKACRADVGEIENMTGWLTTITARECLSLLRARRRRGEVALPDDETGGSGRPAGAAHEETLLAEQVGLALLVVLDRLSPAQRVAFVLHDVFCMPFEDIAPVLSRSPAAAKKLASRARQRVHGEEPSDQRLPPAGLRLAEAFLIASRGGDIETLLRLLAPEVVRRADRELLPDGAAAEISGARRVAEETRLFAARARTGAVAVVDGAPGIVVAPRGRLLAILRLGISADGRIERIDILGRAQRLRQAAITLPPVTRPAAGLPAVSPAGSAGAGRA